MKWILIVSFLTFNLMAESSLSDLPVDVQKDISTTEESQPSASTSVDIKQTKSDDKALAAKEEAATPIVNKATAKENEIPLSLETQKKVATGDSTYFRIMMVIALLGILACGTWIFVRKSKSQNIKRNKNEIKILAQHYLGPKKSIAVVRVAGESILVGITDTQINMIKTLSLMDDELPDVSSQSFKSELDERMTHESTDISQYTVQNTSQKNQTATYNRKSQVLNTKTPSQEEDADEFSIKGIKDLVSSKLKNMRSI